MDFSRLWPASVYDDLPHVGRLVSAEGHFTSKYLQEDANSIGIEENSIQRVVSNQLTRRTIITHKDIQKAESPLDGLVVGIHQKVMISTEAAS